MSLEFGINGMWKTVEKFSNCWHTQLNSHHVTASCCHEQFPTNYNNLFCILSSDSQLGFHRVSAFSHTADQNSWLLKTARNLKVCCTLKNNIQILKTNFELNLKTMTLLITWGDKRELLMKFLHAWDFCELNSQILSSKMISWSAKRIQLVNFCVINCCWQQAAQSLSPILLHCMKNFETYLH